MISARLFVFVLTILSVVAVVASNFDDDFFNDDDFGDDDVIFNDDQISIGLTNYAFTDSACTVSSDNNLCYETKTCYDIGQGVYLSWTADTWAMKGSLYFDAYCSYKVGDLKADSSCMEGTCCTANVHIFGQATAPAPGSFIYTLSDACQTDDDAYATPKESSTKAPPKVKLSKVFKEGRNALIKASKEGVTFQNQGFSLGTVGALFAVGLFAGVGVGVSGYRSQQKYESIPALSASAGYDATIDTSAHEQL